MLEKQTVSLVLFRLQERSFPKNIYRIKMLQMVKFDAEIFISMRGSVFHRLIAASSDRGGLMSVEAADLK